MSHDPFSTRRVFPARPGLRVAAVVSRFHEELTRAMADSARSELVSAGMAPDDFRVIFVPGSLELPLVARRLARRADVDAVLCFGVVVTGETSHDHWVAKGALEGILHASLETDKPVLFGVLTCRDRAQARARALPADRGGREDRGRQVARAALELLAALEQADDGPTAAARPAPREAELGS